MDFFPRRKNPRDNYVTFQDVFVDFPNKLQEANEFLEQPTVVSSAIKELRKKNNFF